MSERTVPQGAQPAIERRLATILMADVAGYSRMMGENEERTVKTLQGHREVFDALLKAHRGRIFNTAGDAILAEFPSAVEAVRCATEIQTALRTRNDHLPPDQRMAFRIGINLGDVIVQGDDLLGDGVNIAARIQTIAEPGCVCISGSVYDQIQNKLTLQIRQLGEKSFKNIAQPVRTFSISDEGAPRAAERPPARNGALVAAGALAALILAGAGAFWLYHDHRERGAEEARRAEEAQRAATVQAKAEHDKAAQADAEREAKLLAELQAAKDALTQAEATKRKAEQDRLAAEAQQREAKLQGEIRSAKEALQKAESERKAEAERAAADAAARNAEATKKAEAERVAAASKAEAAKIDVAKPTDASAGRGVDRLDGAHMGRMCTDNPDGTARCWGVVLNVKHGSLSATWMTRFNNQPAHANGEISADGTVKLALDGYTPNGRVIRADATGTLVDNKLTFSGLWSNGAPITGTWYLNP